MEEEKNEDKKTLKEQIELKIKEVLNEEIQPSNIEYLYKLVDIHKDLENEKYWKEKIRMMYRGNYGGNFDNYGGHYNGGRSRDSMGRYTESGNYGRRGYDTKYRGEDALAEMNYHYGNYHDSGSYGAKEDSTYKMIDCFKEFGYSIAQELEPKDKQMFKQAMQEVMMEMDK